MLDGQKRLMLLGARGTAILSSVVMLTCGIIILVGRTSSKSGSCCLPESCDASSLNVELFPSLTYHTCKITDATAASMGCPKAAKEMQNCSLSYDSLCDTNRAKVFSLVVGILSTVSGVVLIIPAVPTVTLDDLRDCKIRLFVLLIGGIAVAIIYIIMLVFAGMLLHALIHQYSTAKLSKCINQVHVGDTTVCLKYGYPTFSCDDSSSSINGKKAQLYTWISDASGYSTPSYIVVVVTSLGLFVVFFAVFLFLRSIFCKNCCQMNSTFGSRFGTSLNDIN